MSKSQQWKEAERELARDMGGTRTGPRGFGLPDVIHPRWAPEIKYGEQRWFTAQLLKDIKQAETNAKGMPWFVYLREKITGRRFVVVPYKDFIRLLKLENEKYER